MSEHQLDLIKKSGRGGARAGAGRKSGEPTTRVRVPAGCLNAVLELIENYRIGSPSDSGQSEPPAPPAPPEEDPAVSELPPTMDTKSGPVPVKFWWTDPSGDNHYWSGRGRRPGWVNDYLSAGGLKSDLSIKTWVPGGKWSPPS